MHDHGALGRAARGADARAVAGCQAELAGVGRMHDHRVVRVQAGDAGGDAVGVLQRRLVAHHLQRPVGLGVDLAHRRAVEEGRRHPGGAAAAALAGHGVARGADELVPHPQRLVEAVCLPLGVLGILRLAGALVAPAAGVDHRRLAPLLGLQRGLHQRADALHAAQRHVLVGRIAHRRLAGKGDVGRAAQVPVFGAIERVALAVHVGDRVGAKAGKIHRLGERDVEGLHADALAIGAGRGLGLHHRPACGRGLGRDARPRRREAPALVHDRVGHDVVGKGVALVDQRVDRDDQRQLLRVLQPVLDQRADAGDAVQRVAAPQHQRLERVGVAAQRAGEPFGAEARRVGEPGVGGRIGLAFGLAALELGRALVGHVAPDRRAGGLDLAGEGLEVVARTGAVVLEAAAVDDEAALPVEVADQRVERDHRIGVVEAVAGHHAAVRHRARLAAVAGELVGQPGDDLFRNAAGSGVFRQFEAARGFAQQLEGRLHRHRLAAELDHAGGLEHGRHHRGLGGDQLARGGRDHVGVGVLVLVLGGDLHADVRAAHEAALARVAFLGDHQPAGVGEGRFTRRLRSLEVGPGEVGRVHAIVVEHPAHHAQHQRTVGARADRHPAPAVGGGEVVRVVQHRIDHHVVQPPLGAALGELGAEDLERVAGVARRGADEEHELGVGQVGLGVRHLLEVAEQGARAGTIGAAAVRAVADVVERAEGLVPEAAAEVLAAVIDAGEHADLVHPLAQFGRRGVDRSLEVAQRGQAIDMAFAEQVAALHHLLHQLLEGDRLPLARVARTDALHRGEHAEGRAHLVHGRVAAPAGGRAPGQALVLEARQGDHALLHRHLHRQVGLGRQRAVGVADHADDLAAGLVDPHAHAALRGAAQAGGVADLLVGVGGEFAGHRIDGVFRLGRAAVDVAAFGEARLLLAGEVGHHAAQGLREAGGKGGQATGGDDFTTFDFHDVSPWSPALRRQPCRWNRPRDDRAAARW